MLKRGLEDHDEILFFPNDLNLLVDFELQYHKIRTKSNLAKLINKLFLKKKFQNLNLQLSRDEFLSKAGHYEYPFIDLVMDKIEKRQSNGGSILYWGFKSPNLEIDYEELSQMLGSRIELFICIIRNPLDSGLSYKNYPGGIKSYNPIRHAIKFRNSYEVSLKLSKEHNSFSLLTFESLVDDGAKILNTYFNRIGLNSIDESQLIQIFNQNSNSSFKKEKVNKEKERSKYLFFYLLHCKSIMCLNGWDDGVTQNLILRVRNYVYYFTKDVFWQLKQKIYMPIKRTIKHTFIDG